MRTKVSSMLLGLVLACLSVSWMMAQDNDTKSKADTRAITGCLSRGDNAKEFLLTGEDGSTWEVRSSSVSLAKHVGHTVTATGVVKHATAHNLKEDAKDATADAHMTSNNNEHGHMTITDLQMVSESCQK
jgi:hypothetical protein